MLTRATEPPAEVWYQRLNELGLTFTGDYRKSLRAMGRLRKNERDRAMGRFASVTRAGSAPARRNLGSGVLSYEATEKLLDAYGIALVPAVMAQSVGEAVQRRRKTRLSLCPESRIRRYPAQNRIRRTPGRVREKGKPSRKPTMR